jgi:hypothetical protein
MSNSDSSALASPNQPAAADTTLIEDDFSWENFCYAAGRSNRLNTDEVTEQTVGKRQLVPPAGW